MKVILASASPRRQELIKMITEDVIVNPCDCDETIKEGLVGREIAEYLSKIKGKAVKEQFEEEIIVSADTIVCLGDAVLGKPASREDAFNMLRSLSGRTHSVFTGVTIIKGEKQKTFSQETKVTFYDLSDEEIDEYINTNECFDKAGAYGIQGKGGLLVKEISGDYFNVVGLPVAKLKRELNNF
ncbi:MAG: septum formation protein Maf [Clostridia bacterium]|nr:septum formation protein Maf [Clostridia bacterium]